MSSYKRKPNQAVARCSVPGCNWHRLYFDKPATGGRPAVDAKTRAAYGLIGHRSMKHKDEAPAVQRGCCD